MPQRVTFPLPDNYFRPVELSRQDEEQFQAWAMALLQETLVGLHRDQCMTQEQRDRRWKPLKKSGGLTAYRRRSGTEEEGDGYRYLCKGKIDGHLDEVMLGRYADNTDMFRRMNAIYREDLIDCMVLHTIATQSPSNPFFFSGFKWMTVKSPGKGLVKNRDVCWFEQSGLTRDHYGKEIGYHIAQSVDLAACPPFDESVCIRARLSACYLFRRNKSGGSKVFMRGKNNAGGKVLDLIADLKSAEHWLHAERAKFSAMAYISTEMVRAALPSDSHSVPRLGTNNRCELCAERTAGMMSSQKECAVCHRITCSRCVIKRRVLSSARYFLAEEKELFCKRCVRFFHDIKHRDPQNIAMVCAAAASRCEPLGPGSSVSGYSHTYSHSSQASSSSSGSVREVFYSHSSSDRGHAASGPQPPPSPDMIYLNHQDSSRSIQSAHSSTSGAPVVLYPEAMARVTKDKGVRRTAESEASTVASSVATSRYHPLQSSYSSAASEFSDDDSAYSYRDTTDSSFNRHLVGSQASYRGHMVRLGTTDELSPPEVKPPAPAQRRKGNNTPEEMMEQMIRMNIMAEQARQMVKENDKFTQRFNFY